MYCNHIMRRISRQLRAQDPDFPDFQEQSFRDKIIDQLPDLPSRISASHSQTRRLYILPAAGLAAVLLITAGLWVHWFSGTNSFHPTPADLARFNRIMNTTNIDALSTSLIRQSTQQSLEKEMVNLTWDMEKAVQFFTMCLPDT